MVFSPLHYIPSALAALLTIALVLKVGRGSHRDLGLALILSAVIGFLGYLSRGELRFYPLDYHTVHSWLGLAAFVLSLYVVASARVGTKKSKRHCYPGYAAVFLATTSLLTGLILLSGQELLQQEIPLQAVQEKDSSSLPELEARKFQGINLTPLNQQRNNAIRGTQYIDRSTYRLNITGSVEKEVSLNYDEILELPAYSEVVYMPCVEGWGFYAKWTGVRVTDLLDLSGLKPEAKYIIFETTEGYSTSLPLDYLQDNQILLAYGINDLTLPADRGFPFQLVAKDRYGYKWAKWITKIEATDVDKRGYWESRGYSNRAVVGEPPFG
jgi:DMSO/TMAO reductase YedYZ molybdopterin-dependent catalytic subunit